MNMQPAASRREILTGGGALIVAFALRPNVPVFAEGATPAKPLALTRRSIPGSFDPLVRRRHHLFRQGGSWHRRPHRAGADGGG